MNVKIRAHEKARENSNKNAGKDIKNRRDDIYRRKSMRGYPRTSEDMHRQIKT